MVLKIDYDTVKLQKVTYDVKYYVTKNTSSKWRHKNSPFSSSSLSKSCLRSWIQWQRINLNYQLSQKNWHGIGFFPFCCRKTSLDSWFV